MPVFGFIFGHIWRISCWRLPSNLVFADGPHLLIPNAAVAPLPSHCLGTDTFINGSLHAIFQPCGPVWCPESGHFPDPCILLVLLLVKADCWSSCSYRLVLPKKVCETIHHHIFLLLTHVLSPSSYRLHAPFVLRLHSKQCFKEQGMSQHHSICGVVRRWRKSIFFQTCSSFMGWYDWCVVFLALPPPYPKIPVRSNGWKP